MLLCKFMDNLTHSLVAVALSRVFFKKRIAYATTAMVVAANLPDLDLLYSWPGIRYLEFRNGVLHSLLFLPLWALAVALGWRWAVKRWPPRHPLANPPRHLFAIALALGAVGIGSHLLLDWTNNFGVRLFAPVSERWMALDWAPYFDPWIWFLFAALLGVPMLLTLISSEVGVRKNNPHRASAAAALILLCAWFGLRARQHNAALELLNSQAVSNFFNGQLPLDWAAFPTSTPFQWQAIVDLPANYLVAAIDSPWDTDLGHLTLQRNYIKPPLTPSITAAQHTRTGGIFLWFARFPLSDDQEEGSLTKITLTDMRYAEGVQRPPQRATIEMDGSLHIISQSFSW